MGESTRPTKKKKTVVAVSGGFDPVHVGHIRMFEQAKGLGDELVVILNNDNWLQYKKGFVFMPEKERRELLHAIKWVDRVVLTRHQKNTRDISVCDALREVRPQIFANGGDRKPGGDPVPEVITCEKLGIQMVYNVGRGGKIQSSSWLTNKGRKEKKKITKI
ncbi:MAG: adenylyltransferase/cytidyltransferase family protein [Candidatus Paceibacterota bacterium]